MISRWNFADLTISRWNFTNLTVSGDDPVWYCRGSDETFVNLDTGEWVHTEHDADGNPARVTKGGPTQP